MTIQANKVVSLHYRLREDDIQGELIEETYGQEPLSFIHGIGMMIPAFEAQLEGKSTGDTFDFTLEPEEAYGLFDEDAVVEIPKANFTNDQGEIDMDRLALGEQVVMNDQEGNSYAGIIIEHLEDDIVLDFNHPMAGIALHFSGEILGVREATESELDHGHVHGSEEGH